MNFNDLKIVDLKEMRIVKSSDYNMIFKKTNKRGDPSGELFRWGETLEDDPDYAPGPEIADIEISSGGCPGVLDPVTNKPVGCSFCYKDNTPNGPIKNMSLATYKQVLDQLVSTGTLGQVALGICGVKTNPDFLDIMRYTRQKGCWPNFTLTGADLDLEMAVDLADLCGAVAVSCSPTNPDLCFDTVELFTSLGVEQTNIHVVVSEDSIPFVHQVLEARMNDSRLKDMGAVVCLMVKPKGRAKGKLNSPTQEQYGELVHYAIENNIPIGFDSCSCASFLSSVLMNSDYEQLKMHSDACESTLFSAYINVDANFFPCSFAENTVGWEDGISLLESNDFIKDVWMHKRTKFFRDNLILTVAKNNINCRECPIYPELLLSARQ